MDGIKETFTKKVGPLPVWAWAALVVAAILAYMYFTKTGLFGAATPAAGTSTGASNGGYNPATATDTSGGGGGGLGDLGPAGPIDTTNMPGSTATGGGQSAAYGPSSLAGTDTSSLLTLAAPVGSSSSPSTNYDPVYAASPAASGGNVTYGTPYSASGFSSIPIIGPLITRLASVPVQTSVGSGSYNPVRGRTSGTQAF